jgi:hypothetical protein
MLRDTHPQILSLCRIAGRHSNWPRTGRGSFRFRVKVDKYKVYDTHALNMIVLLLSTYRIRWRAFELSEG